MLTLIEKVVWLGIIHLNRFDRKTNISLDLGQKENYDAKLVNNCSS